MGAYISRWYIRRLLVLGMASVSAKSHSRAFLLTIISKILIETELAARDYYFRMGLPILLEEIKCRNWNN